MLLVTNNPMLAPSNPALPLEFLTGDYQQVLLKVKDYIVDQRMVLLTHPLSGSIKPNETYYKSIVLEDGQDAIDLTSLAYIEQAIDVYDRFNKMKQRPNWPKSVLKDFAYVDYYLMESAFERILSR